MERLPLRKRHQHLALLLLEPASSRPLRSLFTAVSEAVSAVGEASLRVSKSQIAFRRRRNFAIVWMPRKYLGSRAAPLVLTIALPHRDPSSRWKQVVEPAPGRFTHHLELHQPAEVNDQIRGWLRTAWEAAR